MKTQHYKILIKVLIIGVILISFEGLLAFSQQPTPTPSSTSTIKPEKPEEELLKLVYNPLVKRVGVTWALIILAVISGLMGIIVKDAIPKLIKWLFSKITRWAARLFQNNIQEYRDWVVREYKEVRVGYKNFEIDVKRNYVSLRIRIGKSEQDRALKEVSEVLQQFPYLVVRGHPGSGKTTLLKYLAIKYAMKEMKALHGKHLIPIFVTLKDAVGSSDLFTYIVRIFDPHLKDAEPYTRKLLKEGNGIVFLDGVDEVADRERRDIALKWIEDFAARFDKSRIVVTLRKEGYEAIAFSAKFEEAEVADLTEPQMKDLATSVLRANFSREKFPDEGIAQKTRELLQIIKASDRLLSLAGNPLLLSIITLVYAERGDLPRKRVELYEECIQLILETREIREKQGVHRFVYNRDQKYRALQELA
ncbi:MAG: NACHT domain-containing protein, partial [Nitrospira sp.]|nr:NACHT domain-containing protein [Nitrospira sp.]